MTKVANDAAHWLTEFRKQADQLPGAMSLDLPVGEILERLEAGETFKKHSLTPRRALKHLVSSQPEKPPWLDSVRESAERARAAGQPLESLDRMVAEGEAIERERRDNPWGRDVLAVGKTLERWHRRFFRPGQKPMWPADMARLYHAAWVAATGQKISMSELYCRAVERPLACAVRVDAPETNTNAEPTRVEPHPAIDVAAKEAWWERLVTEHGGRRAACTHFEPLRDGAAAQAARLQMVRDARSSIVGTLYRIKPDPYGLAFVDELIAARQRNVDVAVLIDGSAQAVSFNLTRNRSGVRKLETKLAELEAAGGQVGWYSGDGGVAAQAHFKSLLVDGTDALMDARNINISYVSRMNDFGGSMRGPVVGEIAAEAFDLLAASNPRTDEATYRDTLERLRVDYQRHADTSRDELHRGMARAVADFTLVGFNPSTDEGLNKLTDALVDAIDHAQFTITLSTNFFYPSKRLRQALIDAGERGVHIRVITTGRKVHRKPYRWLARMLSPTFVDLTGGIRIQETTKKEHGKMIVIDGQIAGFGSYNASVLADDQYAEAMLFTRDPAVIAEVGGALKDTITNHADYHPWPTVYTGAADDMSAILYRKFDPSF